MATVEECVFMVAGGKKNNKSVQNKQDETQKLCSFSASVERTQSRFQKWHNCTHTRILMQSAAFPAGDCRLCGKIH